jgi:signal transduction histidine kinase
MDEGPLTLKERVAHLAGDLTLKSMDTGTALRMRVPFAHTDS